MAVRNPARLFFKRFDGLNSYINPENIAPSAWIAAMNIAVNANGNAEALRSPLAFNSLVAGGNPVLSMADYLSPISHKLLFDIGPANSVVTYTINNDFTNLSIRTGQFGAFISAVVNNALFRLNVKEMVQLQPDETTFFRVGIDPPVAAPVIAFATDSDTDSGTDDALVQDGIQFSYAYYNSTTGHCSIPSPDSNRIGPATGEQSLIHVPVVASVQTGVDKMAFFATLDGGSIPYLLVDSSGNPILKANTTGTYTFDFASMNWNTLTPEPIFNNVPPIGATFMFTWQDRVFLLGFVAGNANGISQSTLCYSGYESCYIGIPGESWPPLNQISIPNKGEVLVGGIGTQLGALILSDLDAYLISGYPTDNTSGPEATTAVTEHLQPFHWNVGTQSPRSIANTPFGTIWLDQTQRLRIWNGQGFPTEVGLPLRAELAALDSTKLASVEGKWFQQGQYGGYYAMIGTLASGAQQLFLVTMYEDPDLAQNQITGQSFHPTVFGYAISNMSFTSLQPVRVNSAEVLFGGGIGQCFTILNPTQIGGGWAGGTPIFFDMVVGNDENFHYWHSIRFDGYTTGLTITIREYGEAVGASNRTITVSTDTDTDTANYGLIDEYGRRKIIRFSYNTTDTNLRQIKNLQIVYENSKRAI